MDRFQIMLLEEELIAVDDFPFKKRMPSRASAVRELLQRGLAAEGFAIASRTMRSGDFNVVAEKPAHRTAGQKSS